MGIKSTLKGMIGGGMPSLDPTEILKQGLMKKCCEFMVDALKPMLETGIWNLLPFYIKWWFSCACCAGMTPGEKLKAISAGAAAAMPEFSEMFEFYELLFSPDILDVLTFEKCIEMAEKCGGNVEEMLPEDLRPIMKLMGAAKGADGVGGALAVASSSV